MQSSSKTLGLFKNFYSIRVVVSTKRFAGSRNTISARLHGQFGISKVIPLGKGWKSGEARTILAYGVPADLGTLQSVNLFTDGKDGLLFDKVDVTTFQDSAMSTTSFQMESFLKIRGSRRKGTCREIALSH